MTLAELIRKRQSEKVATAIPAIPAIPATQPGGAVETVARIATVAVANPTEAKTAPMTAEEDEAIRAWLEHIEETDQEIFSEVMDKCQREGEVRAYFLRRSEEVPKPERCRAMYCRDCSHFDRTDHPHLGHCVKGEPEAIAGLWDTDQRYCKQYQAIQNGGE
jgi:hypothetical protein